MALPVTGHWSHCFTLKAFQKIMASTKKDLVKATEVIIRMMKALQVTALGCPEDACLSTESLTRDDYMNFKVLL